MDGGTSDAAGGDRIWSGTGDCAGHFTCDSKAGPYDEKGDGQGWGTSNKLPEYCVDRKSVV